VVDRAGVTTFLARRLLAAVPLVLGIATLMFFVVHLAPGDPTSHFLVPGMRPETADQIRTQWGLDDPVHVRYVRWMGNLARGDLGPSYAFGRPVRSVLADVLPNTLLLSGAALVLAFLVGIVVGVVQAVREHTWTDTALSVVTLVFYSMPSFWLAIMLSLVFAHLARNVWGWPIYFPVSGTRSLDYELLSAGRQALDLAWHLALPALSLSLILMGGIARHVRGAMLAVRRKDFVRTARAMGLPERTVIVRHLLRNALVPVATLLGLYVPVLLSGTVFIETVFGWPGMGKTVYDAIVLRDYPLVMAATLLFAGLVVVGNLLADILYGLLDPRVRYE
jgi:peptide/nickel transport system permease protein